MVALNVLFGLLGLVLIVRAVVRAVRGFRSENPRDGWFAVFNLLIAVAILLVAALIAALKSLV